MDKNDVIAWITACILGIVIATNFFGCTPFGNRGMIINDRGKIVMRYDISNNTKVVTDSYTIETKSGQTIISMLGIEKLLKWIGGIF